MQSGFFVSGGGSFDAALAGFAEKPNLIRLTAPSRCFGRHAFPYLVSTSFLLRSGSNHFFMEIEELLDRRSALQKRRPIRNRLLVVGLLVGFTVTLLSASSFLGVYSYRRLVKALSSRASELP